MTTSFSSTEIIKTSWHTFKTHWKFIISAGLVTAAIQMILQLIQNGAQKSGVFLVFVSIVFVTLIGMIITLGWSNVLLHLNRHGSEASENFKTAPKIWLHYIKTMVWYFLYFLLRVVVFVLPVLVVWGVVRLIAPGEPAITAIFSILAAIPFLVIAVYFSIKYQFVNYTVLDYSELRSKLVFKKAGDITNGHFWQLVGFGLALMLLNIIGLLCLVIGLVVTIPITKLAQARMYDYLKIKHSSQS